MRTKILFTTLIIALAVSSCQKQIGKPDQSQNEEIAARRGGQGKNPPVANAGNDTTITLPFSTAYLNGRASYDPDNNITSYLWTKISGPSSFSIANANAVQTQVTNLVQGVYQFELKVTDRTRLVDKDTVQVTVQPTQPPPCTSCKIVFVSNRDGNNEIYSCNADGSNLTRLTNNTGDDGQPVWSPDGTRIAFTSSRGSYSELYIMNADGSNVVQRTFSVDPYSVISGLTWSPDGTKIAYSEYIYNWVDETYEADRIYVVSATSGDPLLRFGDGGNPAWSPDGTKIALVAYPDIHTINADGTGFTTLTNGINPGYYEFYYPSWSPNGAKLAVMINEWTGDYYYDYISHVGVMNSDGSGFTTLGGPSAAWGRTSWSGDGTIIMYTSQSGSMWNVSWVAANGSASGTIITNGWDADWQH